MLLYTLALIPISLAPVLLEEAGAMFGFGALGLGVYFLRSVWGFVSQPAHASARKVLHASLIYLPCVMGLLLFVRYVMT